MCVVVGGHHHGGAGPVDPLEQQHDVLAGVRVEVAGRLVGQQHQRPVDERAGDRDPLLLAAGQLVRQPVGLAVEADQLEHLGHDLPIVARGLPITSSANATFSTTVLFGSSRKSWNTQPMRWRRRGTLRPDSLAEVLAGDVERPRGRARPRAAAAAGTSTCRSRRGR